MDQTQRYRVIIIDDNPAIHNDFERILLADCESSKLEAAESALFNELPEVHTAPRVQVELDFAFQGDEGFEKVARAKQSNCPYTLAFVDMRMPPGWDGIETIEHLWQVDPDLQIVICTAYSDYSWDEIKSRIGETSNLLILKKPFDNAEVLQLVQSLTSKWTATCENRLIRQGLEELVSQRTAQLQQQNQFLKVSSEIASVGYWSYDQPTETAMWSETMYDIFGLDSQGAPPSLEEFIQLHDPEDRLSIRRAIERASLTGVVEFRARLAARQEWKRRYVHTKLLYHKRSGGDSEEETLIGATLDVTNYELALQRANYAATHDPLTELANRNRFGEVFVDAVVTATHFTAPTALVLFDLNRFKEVNDEHGHCMGDEVLKAFAAMLARCVGDQGTVARLGGDEFAVTLKHTSREQVLELLDHIIEQMQSPIRVDGIEMMVSTSIGIAMAPEDGTLASVIHRNADLALYKAKASCEANRREFYSEDLSWKQERESRIRRELREAMSNDELRLYFHPIYSIDSMEIATMEALIRWHHPDDGLLLPDAFIGIAESSGDIIEIDRWVLQRACQAAVEWPTKVRVAVNISAVHFSRQSFYETVTECLAATGLPPHRLEIEITETALLTNSEGTIHILTELKRLGVRIVMDDFGIGYSSLGYLTQFPFDGLKLDRSFISDHSDAEEAQAIMLAVGTLGTSLGIETTIEGVETERQFNYAKEIGFNFAQGFLACRPIPEELVVEQLFQNEPSTGLAASLKKETHALGDHRPANA